MRSPSSFNDKDKSILDAILTYRSEHGYAPTLRELCEITGYNSLSYMTHYLARLERFGCIRRNANVARSIVVIGGEEGKFYEGWTLIEAAKPGRGVFKATIVEG